MERCVTLCCCLVLLVGISGIGHSFKIRNVRSGGINGIGDSFKIRNVRSADDQWAAHVDLTGGDTKVLQLPTKIYDGEYNNTEGETVPYTIEAYAQDTEETSLLYGPVNTQLLIESEYFAIEDSDDCMFDYLQLSNKYKFCGWQPLVFITEKTSTDLRFRSDNSYEDRGFRLNIKAQEVEERTHCNNTLKNGVRGIKSIFNAGSNACFYRVEAEGDLVVQLKLGEQNLGPNRPCREESIIIYEGRSTHGKKVAEICSGTTPADFDALNLRAQAFFIEYRNPLNNEEQAFRIDCDFVDDNFPTTTLAPTTPSPVGGDNDCSARYIDLEDDTLTYISPQDNNKHCVIVVRNTLLQDHVVQVKFEYFEIEESENCMFDSLNMYFGERKDSPALGPYCGESLHGRTFVSSGNSLKLDFKTDESFALRGFKAVISFVPLFGLDCSCRGYSVCVQQGFELRCIPGRVCNEANCNNEGTCVEKNGDQTCYCKPGYEGVDCSERTDGGVFLKFKIVPKSRNIEEGDSIYPECVVDVPPKYEVTYRWTLNGKPIDAYTDKNKFGSDKEMLRIDDFSEELEGEYTCIAETGSGIAEHTFQYRMVTNCELSIYPGPGESNQKNVGQNALLQCRVDPADELRHVIWKKDGNELDTSGSGRFLKKSNNYLQISDITLKDAGVYSCHAEDKNGCQTSKKGNLKVLDYRPLNKYCGISTWDEDKIASRISQGQPVRLNEHPWHVNMRTKNVNKIETFCGGSLISQKFVVTAAHCIDDFKQIFKADFSKNTVDLYFGTIDCKGGGTRRSVKSYNIHPSYKKGAKYDNDIAIIELDTPVEYGVSIRPICLGEKGFLDDTFLENSYVTKLGTKHGRVVGCGKKSDSKRGKIPDQLQVVHLPYVHRDECEETLHGLANVTASMFCAGSKVARTGDTCQGDSGGGLVMDTDEHWVLTGIVSYGLGCDRANHFGVYTHVGLFYDWIKGITKFDKEEVENFIKKTVNV